MLIIMETNMSSLCFPKKYNRAFSSFVLFNRGVKFESCFSVYLTSSIDADSHAEFYHFKKFGSFFKATSTMSLAEKSGNFTMNL